MKEMKLIMENFNRFLLTEQKVSYSGVVLDGESVQKLKEAAGEFGVPEGFVFETKAGEPLPHHMTITLGPLGDFSTNYPVGEPITLKATHIGADERAMAVKVEPPAPISEKIAFPHITLAIPEGGKPFFSNKIPEENFKELPEKIEIKGKVEEVK